MDFITVKALSKSYGIIAREAYKYNGKKLHHWKVKIGSLQANIHFSHTKCTIKHTHTHRDKRVLWWINSSLIGRNKHPSMSKPVLHRQVKSSPPGCSWFEQKNISPIMIQPYWSLFRPLKTPSSCGKVPNTVKVNINHGSDKVSRQLYQGYDAVHLQMFSN